MALPSSKAIVRRSKIKGVKYLLDADGKPRTVLLDLKTHGALWEDIQDVLISAQRRKQPSVPWDQVKRGLKKLGKLP